MATGGLTIDITNAEDFEKSIAGIDKVIGGLNKRIDTISDSLDKFAVSIKKPISGLEELDSAFSKIGKLKVSGTLDKTLSGISESISNFTRNAAVSRFQSTIAHLAEVSTTLNRLTEPAGVREFVDSISFIVKSLQSISKVKFKASNVTSITSTIRQVSDIISRFGDVSPASVAAAEHTITVMVDHIFPLLQRMREMTVDKSVTNGLNSISRIAGAIAALGRLPIDRVAAVTLEMDIFFANILDFATHAAILIGNNEAAAGLRAVARNIEGISALLAKFDNLETISRGIETFNGIIKNLFGIVRSMSEFAQGGREAVAAPRAMARLLESFTAFINIYIGIQRRLIEMRQHSLLDRGIRAVFGGSNFVDLGKVFKGLGTVSTEIAKSAQRMTAVPPQTLRAISQYLNSFSTLIQTLVLVQTNVANNFRASRFLQLSGLADFNTRLSQFLSGIFNFMRILSKATRVNLQNVRIDVLQAMGNFMRGLAQLLAELVEVANQIELTNFDAVAAVLGQNTRLSKLLRGIANFMKIMSASLTKSVSASRVSQFKDSIETMGQIFFSLSRLFQVLQNVASGVELNAIELGLALFGKGGRITKLLLGFRPTMDIIGQAITGFANIPNVERISNVIGFLNSFPNFIKALQGLQQSLRAANNGFFNRLLLFFGKNRGMASVLKGLKEFNNELVKAMQGFSALDPSVSAKLSSIVQFMNSLPDFLRVLQEINVAGAEKAEQQAEGSVKAVGSIFKVIGGFVGGVTGGLLGAVGGVAGFILGMRRVTPLVKQLDGFKQFINKLAKGLSGLKKIPEDAVPKIQAVANITNAIGSLLKNVDFREIKISGNIEALSDAISSIMSAVAEGISQSSVMKSFEKAGQEMGAALVKGIKNELKIASPSQVLIAIGKFAVQGFIIGVQSGKKNLQAAITSIVTIVVKVFKGASALLNATAKFLIDGFRKIFIDGIRTLGRQAAQELTQVGNQLRQTGQSLFRQGLTNIVSGGIVGFLFGTAAQQTGEFNQVLKQIEIFGKLTSDGLVTVRSEIEAFSAATIFSSKQSADALLGLMKAGLDTTSALATLPVIGNLAQAAQLDLSAATDLVIQSIGAFGLSFSDATRIANTFVGAADISTASVDGIGQALSFVGPSAAALGISIEQVSAALALLNDTGITGERAGTGLRAVFDSLAAPTDAAAASLARLGVQVTDSKGNFVGLDVLLRDFAEGIGDLREQGMGDVEIISQLSDLGDRNAVSALLALIKDGGGTMIELADGTKIAASAFDEYMLALAEANTAEAIATAQADTFLGTITSLRGSLENLRNKAMTPLIEGPLKELAAQAINVVNAFTELPSSVLASVAAFSVMSAAAITLLGGLQLLAGFIAFTLSPVFSGLGLAIKLALNPLLILKALLFTGIGVAAFAPIITLLAALSAAGAGGAFLVFREIRDNVGGANDKLKELGTSLSELGSAVSGLFSSFMKFIGVFNPLKRGADDSLGFVATLVDRVKSKIDNLTSGLNEVKLLFDTVLDIGKNEKVKINVPVLFSPQGKPEDLIEEGVLKPLKHTVESGDTLSAIAAKYGVSLSEIIKLNPQIEDPNLIFPNQKITLPVEVQTTDDFNSLLTDPLRLANEEVGTLESNLQKLVKTQLFKSIFGDDTQAVADFMRVARSLDKMFDSMGKNIGRITGGFQILFGGDTKEGIKEIGLGVGNLLRDATLVIESLFGINISDALQKSLQSGNILDAVGILMASITKEIFRFSKPIARAVGDVVTFAIKNLLIPLPFALANMLGIDFFDPILKPLQDIAGGIGQIVTAGVSEAFSVLSGEKDAKQAIDDFLVEVKGIIDENQTLSEIYDTLGLGNIDFDSLFASLTELGDTISGVVNSESFKSFVTEIGRLAGGIITITVELTKLVSSALIIALGEQSDGSYGGVQALADAVHFLNDGVTLIGDSLKILNGDAELSELDVNARNAAAAITVLYVAMRLLGAGAAIAALIGGISAVTGAILALGSAVIGVGVSLAVGVFALSIIAALLAPVVFLILYVKDELIAVGGDIAAIAGDVLEGDWDGAAENIAKLNNSLSDLGDRTSKATIGNMTRGIIDLADAIGILGATGQDVESANVNVGFGRKIIENFGLILSVVGTAIEILWLKFKLAGQKAVFDFLNEMPSSLRKFLGLESEKEDYQDLIAGTERAINELELEGAFTSAKLGFDVLKEDIDSWLASGNYQAFKELGEGFVLRFDAFKRDPDLIDDFVEEIQNALSQVDATTQIEILGAVGEGLGAENAALIYDQLVPQFSELLSESPELSNAFVQSIVSNTNSSSAGAIFAALLQNADSAFRTQLLMAMGEQGFDIAPYIGIDLDNIALNFNPAAAATIIGEELSRLGMDTEAVSIPQITIGAEDINIDLTDTEGQLAEQAVALLDVANPTEEQQRLATSALSNLMANLLSRGLTPADISDVFDDLGVATSISDAIITNIGTIAFEGETFSDLGIDIVTAIGGGIEASAGVAEGQVRVVSEKIQGAFDDEFQRHSPSQWGIDLGEDIMLGINQGLMNNVGVIAEPITLIINEFARLRDGIQAQVDLIMIGVGGIGGAVSAIPTAGATPDGSSVPTLPFFASGGYTGNGKNPFAAVLHPYEYVVPQDGTLVMKDFETIKAAQKISRLAEVSLRSNAANNFDRRSPIVQTASFDRGRGIMSQSNGAGGGETTQIVFEGDIIIENPTGAEVTPDTIAQGMQLWERRNPVNRKMRN